MTDRGRQAVYDAEDAAFVDTVWHERLSFDDATSFARHVCAQRWWADHVAVIPEVVATRADAQRSYAWGATSVHLSPGGCRAHIVLHELAHVATHATCGAGHGHGPAFRGVHVALADRVLGVGAGRALHDRYRAARLTIDPAAGWPSVDGLPAWAAWWAAHTRARLASTGPARGPIAL